MTCSACSSHVEKSALKLPGMKMASVNLLTGSMQVEYDEAVCSEEMIVKAVEKGGYGAYPEEENGEPGSGKRTGENTGRKRGNAARTVQEEAEKTEHAMKLRLGISVGFWIPLMYLSMHHMFYEWFGLPVPDFVRAYFHGPENASAFAFTQLLLLLPILYMNRKYFSGGFRSLWHRSPNMDTLIAIGSSAAILYGIYAIYRIGYGLGHGQMEVVEHYSMDLYFESAGTILTLITVGKYLESRSKGKTSEAISRLLDLSPKMAFVERDGETLEIPTGEVEKGDIFLVKPGSLIPVDGVVLEGMSSIDEAAITGESIPVEKAPGDKVVSATMNKAGFLKCRAVRVGEDTTLSQIIHLVEEAGASKAPIAKLADKIAGVFVPVVMGIAALSMTGWLFAGQSFEFAMSTAIAVLVISCPCALGLATPVAIMVGTGVGAKHGILFKSGEALQAMRDIDTVVLDKTGTITEGRPSLAEIWCTGEREEKTTDPNSNAAEKRLLQWAASLEKSSEHPLAEALVSAAEEQNVPLDAVTGFQADFGKGIRGRIGENSFLLGKQAYLEENGIKLSEMAEKRLSDMAEDGKTPLVLAKDGKIAGILAVADSVKATSRQALSRLKRMGIHTVMLTGDNRVTAEAIRRTLPIEEVIAEVLPEEKAEKIAALRAEGRKVAMIGDGINDAPALAGADVGIAIGAGTDVAIESADVVLMRSDLTDAVAAIRLGRAVIRNIKQNLFWAFFYNCIGIPIAAGLLYPINGMRLNPMFGAAAMSFSSLFVVSNALRLKSFQPERERTEVPDQEEEEKRSADVLAECVTERQFAEKEGKMHMKKVIKVEGMMCAHCTGRVQKTLEGLAFISGVEMNLEEKSAVVKTDASFDEAVVRAAIADAGYEVTGISEC